jgi:Ner family transcriptional regulator
VEQLPDWQPPEIAAELEKRGYSLARLSIEHGCDPHAVVRTLQRPWPMMERVIATKLGVAPQTIWPSRYNDRGLPFRGSRHS